MLCIRRVTLQGKLINKKIQCVNVLLNPAHQNLFALSTTFHCRQKKYFDDVSNSFANRFSPILLCTVAPVHPDSVNHLSEHLFSSIAKLFHFDFSLHSD